MNGHSVGIARRPLLPAKIVANVIDVSEMCGGHGLKRKKINPTCAKNTKCGGQRMCANVMEIIDSRKQHFQVFGGYRFTQWCVTGERPREEADRRLLTKVFLGHSFREPVLCYCPF